jgi:hypothetical protein
LGLAALMCNLLLPIRVPSASAGLSAISVAFFVMPA